MDSSDTFGGEKVGSGLPVQDYDKHLNWANEGVRNDVNRGNDSQVLSEISEERRRLERVKAIDRLIVQGQERLQQLICEKDILQRRPNPLFDYTTESAKASQSGGDRFDAADSSIDQATSRQFKFPPDDLVDEYLEMIFWSRRLTKVQFGTSSSCCYDLTFGLSNSLDESYTSMERH